MSKIYLPSLISFTLLVTGCMTPFGARPADEPSSLNTYLNQQAATKQPDTSSVAKTTKPPTTGDLVKSDSAEVSLAKKLAARLEEAKQSEVAATPEEKPHLARLAALSLPEADKEEIRTMFASATESQWDEVLARLEPLYGPDATIATDTSSTNATPNSESVSPEAQAKQDMVEKFASQLAQRHLDKAATSATPGEQPQRLPSTKMHQDTSHLAAADPNQYPKTIDLERGRTSTAVRQIPAPQQSVRKDTNIQLVTHVPKMDDAQTGLYPEDLQSTAMQQLRNDPKSLPDKMAGPKRSRDTEEETINDLSNDEHQVMRILWEKGQISLEAMHKAIVAESAPNQSRSMPDPRVLSIDEVHTILFDLKQRGWVADTRRGQAVVYWAARGEIESDSGNWQEMIADTIRQLEQVASNSRLSDEERTIAQLRLRMMYLVADRKTEAMERVEGLSTEEQEVWSNTLFGLSDYMNVEEISVSRRHTLALGSFRRAMTHLEAASPLELQNLEFIQSVDSFGQFKPFPSHDFQAKQEVLLYVEVDNFSSKDVGGQFETVLQSSYEIYDQGGRRIDARHFPEVKDLCRVRRRDFYVPYRIYMPDDISPGTYRLELTVRDPSADKFGQSSIEFRIK